MKKIITFFGFILLILSSNLNAQTFYEAEAGTLFGIASIQDCSNCSGGKQVGDLGYERYFTYDVTVAQTGIYKLKFGYSTAQDRSIFISANEESPTQVVCNNGEWSTKSDREIEIKLAAGVNKIKFYNPNGWAPNIDGFSLELLPNVATYYEAETGSTLYGVATVQDCSNCSAGKQVNDLGYERYMTYDVTVPETGSYNLKLVFNSGDARSVSISANDGSPVMLTCWSADWGLYANQDVTVNLVSGVNTLKFYNDNGWAPNIDAFSLRLKERDSSTYYEAENGVLFGVASAQDCGNCSGGKQVGDLGFERYFTYDVTVVQAGTYKLKFGYSTAQDRSIFIAANNDAPARLLCNNGEWNTKSDREVEVKLASGVNKIKFYNPNDWAPNIDGFSLELLPTAATYYEAETGSTLVGVATIQNCTSCSGGKQVGDLGYDRYMTYDVTIPEAGTYNLKMIFNSGDPRTMFVSANGGTAAELSCWSGNWDSYANQDVSIDLIAGVNTLKFFNDSGWAPNIDAFSLRLSSGAVGSCANCDVFEYGDNGTIAYNTTTGVINVYQGDQLMIKDAYSELSNNSGAVYTSKDYTQRTINKSTFSDNIGSGNKVIVSLTGGTHPPMKQIFYVYDGKPYFLMDVSIEGTSLESNYMAPLVSSEVNIDKTGDNRVLFVPFDNDAFVRYQSKSMSSTVSNISSEVTAFYENNSRNGFIVGSVEHDIWKTGVETEGIGNNLSKFRIWGGYTASNVTRDQIEHGKIKGSSVKSPKVFIGFYDDWRTGMEDYAVATSKSDTRYIAQWNKATPIGWNSWGVIKDKLTFDKAIANAEFFANEIPMFRSGDTAFIDLDSYWDNMVSGGLTGDFSKLNEFVQYCKAHNLKAGIYWTPFVDWGDWDRQIEGSSHRYPAAWTKVNGNVTIIDGGRAMDPTHPGTKDRINFAIDKFKASGFEMIKLDFLGHAAVEADQFYNANVTTGMQAYKEGMEYLLNRIGNDMLVYAAISPNMATGRYAHMRRIACDAWADINSSEYTLNSNTYGWWQSKLYDYIDGDHIVFTGVTEGENRARMASGIVNGSFVNGDDFSVSGAWVDAAKKLLQNQSLLDLVKVGTAFTPVEGNSNTSASELFVNEVNGKNYLVVLNYGNAAKAYQINIERLGLVSGGYCVRELFTGSRFTLKDGSLAVNLGAKDAAIYEFNPGENACVFSLPDNYKILSRNVSCNGKSDGYISIELKNTDYKYMVQMSEGDPIVIPAGTGFYEFKDLTSGTYNICFTIDGIADYEQCFEIDVTQPETIDVSSKFDNKSGVLNLELNGADRFYVSINGEEKVYVKGSYDIDLQSGTNSVAVRGDLECQGSYFEKIYVSESLRLYPNPTSDVVQIFVKTESKSVDVQVFDIGQRCVLQEQEKVESNVLSVDLSDLQAGVYLVKISDGDINQTFKVIKK
ncbi:T9SS type A sorting domain-containing protein [Flavobacterium daejeonense]|uniref:T9SS type A sorting domain-containing protein n=1 Tax=Flavobacterium daejeonense TaxID=350893 RepID=UPI000690BD9E|nr:T9SS type A sorting domain-containing protein [Flavobacterium daejeonense]